MYIYVYPQLPPILKLSVILCVQAETTDIICESEGFLSSLGYLVLNIIILSWLW